MKRLSGMDAAFLYMETPTQHMHVCGTMVLQIDEALAGDPANRRTAASRASLAIVSKLARRPAFRRHIAEAPLGMAHPTWAPEDRFRAVAHVRWARVAAPGTSEQFAEVVGRIAAQPLPRAKPLWELWMVEGLERGRIGAVLKVHHSIVDGISGMGVLADLVTTEPDASPARYEDEPLALSESPGRVELALSAIGDLIRAPARWAGTFTRTAPRLLRGAMELRHAEDRPALLFSTPRTTLNRSLTGERAVAFGRVPLAALKRIKNAFGVTVNDVVLAACSMALGDYLAARGERPDRALVASVPVSEHVPDEAAGTANRVSAMFVGMPVHLEVPEQVLAAVHEQSRRAKHLYGSFGANLLAEWAELAPPALFSSAADLYSRWKLADRLPPVHSAVVSNVPGPPMPLYLGGLLLEAAYPLGPVMEGAGINITVVSYAGSIDIGIIACPRSIRCPAEVVRAFKAAVDRLDASAADRTQTTSR